MGKQAAMDKMDKQVLRMEPELGNWGFGSPVVGLGMLGHGSVAHRPLVQP